MLEFTPNLIARLHLPSSRLRRQRASRMSAQYGPWEGSVLVNDFLAKTLGVTFAARPDMAAQLQSLSVVLFEEFINDVSDLKHKRCTYLFLETLFEKACPGKSAGLLAFVLKHLGERDSPWEPAKVEAPAPAETRVTADTAAVASNLARFGRAGAGGAQNDPNWPEAEVAFGSHPSYVGLTAGQLSAIQKEIKPLFR